MPSIYPYYDNALNLMITGPGQRRKLMKKQDIIDANDSPLHKNMLKMSQSFMGKDGRHGRDKVAAVLFAVGLAQLDPSDFRYGIPLIGGLQWSTQQ